MTSPTHDATALAAAFVLFPPSGDASPLLVTTGLICVMGLLEAVASVCKRREDGAWRVECQRLRERGVRPESFPYEPRWKGPRRSVTRPMRLLALWGAASVSMPIAVALGCARLPDQLEVGPIDHRRLTHFLLTAAVIVYGARYGLLSLPPDVLSSTDANAAWEALATGYGAHLAMDGCTKHGVPLLWPAIRRNLHLTPKWMRPRTGHVADTIVMLGALAGVALAVQS